MKNVQQNRTQQVFQQVAKGRLQPLSVFAIRLKKSSKRFLSAYPPAVLLVAIGLLSVGVAYASVAYMTPDNNRSGLVLSDQEELFSDDAQDDTEIIDQNVDENADGAEDGESGFVAGSTDEVATRSHNEITTDSTSDATSDSNADTKLSNSQSTNTSQQQDATGGNTNSSSNVTTTSPTPSPSPTPTPTIVPSLSPTPIPTPTPTATPSPTPEPSPTSGPVIVSRNLWPPGPYTPDARGTVTFIVQPKSSGYWDFTASGSYSNLEPHTTYQLSICGVGCSSHSAIKVTTDSQGNGSFNDITFGSNQGKYPINRVMVWEVAEPGPVPENKCVFTSLSSPACLSSSLSF